MGVVLIAGWIINWFIGWYWKRNFFYILLWIGRKFSCDLWHNLCIYIFCNMSRSRMRVFSYYSFSGRDIAILENT